MPSVRQYFTLADIKTQGEFSATTYHNDLHDHVHCLANSLGVALYNNPIAPQATFTYGPNAIVNALMNQFFLITLPGQQLVITCNPHHSAIQHAHGSDSICLTTPEHFLHLLANQNHNNPIEGLWHLCHFLADHLHSSDIHICQRNGLQFNQNGHFQFLLPLPEAVLQKLIYVIKLKGLMDPSSTKKPQDGAYRFIFNALQLDGRIASLPTRQGELISLRLFHQNQQLNTLEDLGFSLNKITHIRQLLTHKNGLILVTGSTGAGKTTTLYSMLNELEGRHIITLEDPIEKIIPHANQTAINQMQGYALDTALKAILRHNPDVIAIGEIRDEQTANAVINAAYSGHLILASLHTNSIETTLLRLLNLGISPFLMSYCLRGIIAQSLTQFNNKQQLTSDVFICKTPPTIINNINEDLPTFLEKNIRITE